MPTQGALFVRLPFQSLHNIQDDGVSQEWDPQMCGAPEVTPNLAGVAQRTRCWAYPVPMGRTHAAFCPALLPSGPASLMNGGKCT